MSDLGGGPAIGAIWDKKAGQAQAARTADAGKAFQRTRMAPAVSHEKGTDYITDYMKRKPLKKLSTRPVASRRSR